MKRLTYEGFTHFCQVILNKFYDKKTVDQNINSAKQEITKQLTTEINKKVDKSELFDRSNIIKTEFLPSYVDDVIEGATKSNFPSTGESGKIYVAIDSGKTYRWSGTAYVVISETIVIGETSGTAYSGLEGKKNRDSINKLNGTEGTQGSVDYKIKQKTDLLIGGATEEYNTLGKIEAILKAQTKLINEKLAK